MRPLIASAVALVALSHGAYAAAETPADDSMPTVIPLETKRTGDDDKGIFNFVFENDIFGGEDRDYTNGVRASWLSSESSAPDSLDWAADHFLPLSSAGKKRISLAVGQSIYTPSNTFVRDPDPRDRPYAGWLYGSLGAVSDTGSRLDNVMLTLGMVGPASGAEQTQKFIHSSIGDDIPQGWAHQLHNEPGVILTFERKWRSLYHITPLGLGFDATPSVGTNLGNISTDASAGMTFRLGYDLPADYGPPRIRPSLPGSDFFVPTENLGGYLFAGFEGRAVARNIFLDGNTFQDSPSVDKNNFVGGLQAGAAVTYGAARLSYTHILLTREFKGQNNPEQFGAVTLSYRF